MKKFNLLFLNFCFVFVSYAQIPTAVTVPFLEKYKLKEVTLQQSMNSAMVALQAKQEAIDKAMQASSWLQNLKTAKRLLSLIESVVCNARELNMAMSTGHHSCFVNFEYEMVILKIQMAADFIGIILATNRITAGDRMKTLNDVVTRFEEAQQSMSALVKKLEGEIQTEAALKKLSEDPPSKIRFVFTKKK